MRIKTILLVLIIMMPFVGAAFDYSYLHVTMLNQDPDPADQGNYVELRWKVQKLGNEMIENLTFKLDVDYPFSFDASDKPIKSVGDWDGYSEDDEFFTLYYKIRVADDAIEGTYNVVLTASQNGAKYQKIGEYPVRISEKKIPDFAIGTIQTDPVKLVSDTDEAKVDVQIENIGDGNAENVKVELAMPEGFTPSYSYSERVNLGTLSADSSETATFYLDIDDTVSSGDHESGLKITYKEADDDDNEIKEINLPFDLQVKDKPDFEITNVLTDPKNVGPGDTVTLRLTVKNVGGKDADSVSIRMFKDSSQPFKFDEKSDYIGKLKPGEEGTGIVKMTVDEEAVQKEYNFDVEIRSIYQDDVIVSDDTINMVVNHKDQPAQTTSPMIGILIIVVIVVAALVGFFIGKKKR